MKCKSQLKKKQISTTAEKWKFLSKYLVITIKAIACYNFDFIYFIIIINKEKKNK